MPKEGDARSFDRRYSSISVALEEIRAASWVRDCVGDIS